MIKSCKFCGIKYKWDGITLHSTVEAKYKYNAAKYCSYSCHKNARIELRKKNIEEKYGSMDTFNNGNLRRTTQRLRAQGISEEGIKEFKNNQIRKDIECVCTKCGNKYIGDNIRIHHIKGKKKGYNASLYCSGTCAIKSKISKNNKI